jgi:hypothetical protein
MAKGSNQRTAAQPTRRRGMDAQVPTKAGDDRPGRPGLVIGPTEGGPDVELVPARLAGRSSAGRGKRRGK